MRSICVYCGASPGSSPLYAEAARQLAHSMVEKQIELVYGGGNVGLMGIIADEVLRLGGKVTGVIPHGLVERELAHKSLTELHIVKDMHERKAKMAALAEGFIALPGGMGTLEELFEMLTWSQLGFHQKPVGLINVSHFYDGLLRFLQHASASGFIKPAHLELLHHADDADSLINTFCTLGIIEL
jgi:uncharacterized protein (TIGR00730 family)